MHLTAKAVITGLLGTWRLKSPVRDFII